MTVAQFKTKDKSTATEAVGAGGFSTPIALMGDASVQLTQGSAATVVTVQRHPPIANTLRTPPGTLSADWAPYTSDVITVDASAGAVVLFSEVGVAWYRVKVSLACQVSVSGQMPE